MQYLTSALSLNMLGTFPTSIDIREIPLEEAKEMASEFDSVVGHPDTATVFGEMLGVPVPFNRTTVALAKGDQVLVGQYRGPRLPEGATQLPEGATILWLLVDVR